MLRVFKPSAAPRWPTTRPSTKTFSDWGIGRLGQVLSSRRMLPAADSLLECRFGLSPECVKKYFLASDEILPSWPDVLWSWNGFRGICLDQRFCKSEQKYSRGKSLYVQNQFFISLAICHAITRNVVGSVAVEFVKMPVSSLFSAWARRRRPKGGIEPLRR